jgi:DNA-binding CsgD family transcriptional regulator
MNRDRGDDEESDMTLVQPRNRIEPMLVTILLDGEECRIVSTQPVVATGSGDDVRCAECQDRMRVRVTDATTLRGQPRAWALLTGREREVAHLAATGRTNRSIATQLGISLRTVENHLGRTYSKLGIDGRVELLVLWALSPDDAPPRHLRPVLGPDQ